MLAGEEGLKKDDLVSGLLTLFPLLISRECLMVAIPFEENLDSLYL